MNPSVQPVGSAPRRRVARGLWRGLVLIWKYLVGAILTQFLCGGLLILGWTLRAMQRATLKYWWSRSMHRHCGLPFGDWLRTKAPLHPHVHWPNWFLENNFIPAWRERGSFRWTRKMRLALATPWLSLGRNLKQGCQGLFNVGVLTLPGSVLMLFSWYDGWNNSFHKGYEQAWVGPLLGWAGVLALIAALLYLPMAQARQAATGRWRAFYQCGLVWGLIRRHRLANLFLSLSYALLFLPLMILKTAPYFLPQADPGMAALTTGQVVQFLTGYFLLCGLAVFPLWLATRLIGARLYAGALLNDLQRGTLDVAALGEEEREALRLLDLIQIHPQRSRHVLIQVAAQTGLSLFRAGGLVLTAAVWFTLVAQIYISEFLNYHPFVGWLNQPLIQLPWFRYIPPHAQNPWFEALMTGLVLLAVFGCAGLIASLRRLRRRLHHRGRCDLVFTNVGWEDPKPAEKDSA